MTAPPVITIRFVQRDGTERTVRVPAGWTVMEAGRANDIDGIIGECGGTGSCGTCRVTVTDPAMQALVGPAAPMEADTLSYFGDCPPGGRLGCQITLSQAMDGMRLLIPVEG
ncbi:2Fe-2S iron-sulfur cluster-binding protein [Niveispirillum sp. KHB5.9]|uniref:2Fe-2S iron-sulfur cluster-binding protein n=1 Tax=Niveispirillum sp. KHB5.9 TaxID=3400269 RepID=UPI003A84680F